CQTLGVPQQSWGFTHYYYVKRLFPDSLGNLTDTLPSLKTGEALLIGDSIVMPSIVKIEECTDYMPSSNDIKYIEIWKKNGRT
ncbi:MAG: hypothetical protein ACC651_09110, partial [Candidatus Scalindua sp.]